MPKKKAGGKKTGKSKKKSKDSSVDSSKLLVKSSEDTLFESCKVVRWWLNEECSKINAYFASDQEDRDERAVTTDEFVMALKYLQVPITSYQIELIVKYLENATSGFVDLLKFKDLSKLSDQQLLKISQTTQLVNEDTSDERIRKKKGKELVKQMINSEYHMDTETRHVQLKLSLATFKDYKKHPGHFVVYLTTTTTVHGVLKLIQDHEMTVRSVALFSKSSCTKDSYLSPSRTLESYGIRGSLLQHDPSIQELYYDYIPDFKDCPLLMTDLSMRHIFM